MTTTKFRMNARISQTVKGLNHELVDVYVNNVADYFTALEQYEGNDFVNDHMMSAFIEDVVCTGIYTEGI
jgi:hypothetical protein